MFDNELTLLETENYKQIKELNKEDEKLINNIMKRMSIFKINSYDAQVVKRDLIGMAQEQKLIGSSLRDSIGDDVRGFTDEIIKNSEGPCIKEIILNYMSSLSGYFFIWFIPAFLVYGNSPYRIHPVLLLFYFGSATTAFIAEGLLSPFFCTEKGNKKYLETIIFILIASAWGILYLLTSEKQNYIEVNSGVFVILSVLIYLVVSYLKFVNIKKLAKDKSNYIEDLK